MNEPWPMVPLTSVLQLQRRWIKLNPTDTYREIGVRCFGNGVFHKAPIPGSVLGNKRVLSIEPGDLVFNNVFAWEGAVAVAGAEEAGMIGSHRFVTYTVNPERSTPEFLKIFFSTITGREILLKASPGSAGRNKTLGLDRFISQSMPLPPLAEQQRIVAKIDKLASKIDEAMKVHRLVAAEQRALEASFTNQIFDPTAGHDWPTRPLGDVAEIRSGVTLGRVLTGPTVRRPYLRVANVQDGRLDLRIMKEVDVRPEEFEGWRLIPGDLLLTEGGDWDKLGRGTVWRGEIPDCIHQNHIFRVRLNPQVFDPDFVAILTASPYGKAYFQAASKQTTNLASINQRQLKAFPVYEPPLDEQRRVVGRVRELREKITLAGNLHHEAGKELEAMLPAILDRAFKGEL